MLKVGILISNYLPLLKALMEGVNNGIIPAEISLIIANEHNEKALRWAKEAGIPTNVIKHQDYPSRETFERAIHDCLQHHNIQFVCLAGFERILTSWFVEKWWDRLVNCHPALLPAFKGMYTCSRALKVGVKFSGFTIHFVRPPVDEGPIVIQGVVPVLPDETPRTLRIRISQDEKRGYVQVLRWIAMNRVKVVDECVIVDDIDYPSQGLLNPCTD